MSLPAMAFHAKMNQAAEHIQFCQKLTSVKIIHVEELLKRGSETMSGVPSKDDVLKFIDVVIAREYRKRFAFDEAMILEELQANAKANATPDAIANALDWKQSVKEFCWDLLYSNRPPLEDVLKYTEKAIKIAINKDAKTLPKEQQDEIRNEALYRVLNAHSRMNISLGYKSFIQRHCSGAVKDYIRGGNGFEESDLPAADGTSDRGIKLKHRVSIIDEETGEAMDPGDVAGIFGRFESLDQLTAARPNWPLIARLAGKNKGLHIVAKILLGYGQEEIAAQYEKGITRERLSQKLYEFFEALDHPANLGDPETEQMIYALGLCDYYHMAARDNGYGWNFQPFDLIAKDSFEQALKHYEPSFAGVREQRLKRSDIYGRFKLGPRKSADLESSEVPQTTFNMDLH